MGGPLNDLRQLAKIGSTPIYEVTPEDGDFFKNHPLTEKIQSVVNGHLVLNMILAWLDEQPCEVWSLTVDQGKSIVTTLYDSEAECFNALRENYDEENDLRDLEDAEMVQTLIDEQGLVIYIDSHNIRSIT